MSPAALISAHPLLAGVWLALGVLMVIAQRAAGTFRGEGKGMSLFLAAFSIAFAPALWALAVLGAFANWLTRGGAR